MNKLMVVWPISNRLRVDASSMLIGWLLIFGWCTIMLDDNTWDGWIMRKPEKQLRFAWIDHHRVDWMLRFTIFSSITPGHFYEKPLGSLDPRSKMAGSSWIIAWFNLDRGTKWHLSPLPQTCSIWAPAFVHRAPAPETLPTEIGQSRWSNDSPNMIITMWSPQRVKVD